VSQAVVLLLNVSVRHASNPRPLLRQAEVVGPPAVRSAAWRLYRLRPAVVRTSVPGM
jgi:hypothetical protein